MAGNTRRYFGLQAPRPRTGRQLRLEQLEGREVPAIIQNGIPSWVSGGPHPAINGQTTGLTGTFNNPTSGAVEEIATHPTDANIVFVAGVNGGVWRSTNATDVDPTYSPLTDQLPSLSIGSMSLNPLNPNQLIAGISGRSAARLNGDLIGAIYTENALDPNPSFRVLGPLGNQNIEAVLSRPGYLLAAGDNGVYRSTDSGATVQFLSNATVATPGQLPVQPANAAGVYYYADADPTNPNIVYVAGRLGVFRTNNFLAPTPVWTDITDPRMQIGANTSNIKLSINGSPAGTVVYIGVVNGGSLVSVLYSTQRGQTGSWNLMDLPVNLAGPQSITDASNASPIVVTIPNHGYANGDRVKISGVTGNLAANAIWTVSGVTATTFALTGSVGTGVYTGGGIAQKIDSIHPGGQGDIHFGLTADRNNPNIVYVSGDRQDSPFPNGVGAINFTGNIMRGNRSVAPGFNEFAPSPQWSAITDNNALGTAPHADSRVLAMDVAGNLLEGDDGGLYKRLDPQTDVAGWVSINGNLDLGQFYSTSYDIQNNVIFGGTQDTGSIAQIAGGSTTWMSLSPGDGGASAADNTSSPGQTIRYTSGNLLNGTVRRSVYNSMNIQVGPTTIVNFGSPTDPNRGAGLDASDKGLTIFTAKIELNKVDPRLVMVGNNKLYEDNNPAGRAGDVVAQVTPTGLTGQVSAVVYGGRTSGNDVARVAYVGSSNGQLFIRSASGGFNQVTIPGTGPINSIAVDPDDFRQAYALRSNNQVYFTSDLGANWTDITENLTTTVFDQNGNAVGGLALFINELALWDSTPNSLTGGGVVLLAAGRGGVFRYEPSIVPPFAAGGWTEYGTGLPNTFVDSLHVFGNTVVIGTQGRGAWSIPNVAPTIQVAAQITLQGDAGDNAMSIAADPSNPNTVVVSDGLGNTLRIERSTSPTFRFNGGAGADTITIAGSGKLGGDLTFVKAAIVVDAGGDVGDKLVIQNTSKTSGATVVSVTATSVGAGPTDNIFSALRGTSVTYTGLANGQLVLDLGTATVDGNVVNVRSTSAGLTSILGTNGTDTFSINGTAGFAGLGDLKGITGTVQVDGRNGVDALFASDFGALTGNANVTLRGDSILGFAGPTDAAIIQFSNTESVTVRGSNSPTLAEGFRVENPTTAVRIEANDGPDSINVRANTSRVDVIGGLGNDTIRVSSLAGDTDTGSLNTILGPVSIDGAGGQNQLIVSDFGSPFGGNVTISDTSVTGATPAPITYASTGGSFTNSTRDGILYSGSNVGNDRFTINSTLAGSQTAVAGNGGDDTFSVIADNLAGGVELRGGTGSDSFTIDSGIFGVTASSLRLSGNGGGTDTATLLGFEGDDKAPVVVSLLDAVSGVTTGVGNLVNFDTLTKLNYDGRTGRNNLTFQDSTNQSYGTFDNPAAGVVYSPKGVTSGEIRIAGGSVGPIVNVTNINGSDAGGLVYNGDPSGNGTKDVLTVLGVSDVGLGESGALAETTALNGSDEIGVSDQFVTFRNQSLGDLRTIALGRTADVNTLSTLIIRAGDEATKGDKVNVTPSRELNIYVDGGGPVRKKDGDKLTVNTAEVNSLQRVTDPVSGTTQTRVVADSGASFGFTHFENVGGARNIYAVGADAGGGPRVRVYDSTTQEVLFDRFVYAPTFTGGVRVATGDVNGDGVPDLVVAAGYGGGPHVQAFDGITFKQIANFFAYETTFSGGVFLAVGDLTGDGVGEILTGAGLGGGPLVKVFDGTGRALTAFFAYDSAFRGGVRVAAGDINGDGNTDIITGAGPGGGPRVRVLNAKDLSTIKDFLAYEADYREGIYLAAGDLNGDGVDEVVVGPGGNSVPELRVLNSKDGSILRLSVFDIGVINGPNPLPTTNPSVLTAVGAPAREEGGIRVAVTDIPGDTTKKQILTSRGPGYASRIHAYTIDPLKELNNFLAFEPGFDGGVFVG